MNHIGDNLNKNVELFRSENVSDRTKYIPHWVQDVKNVYRELHRISIMFEKLRRNTMDDELIKLTEELELQIDTLGERYVSLGNDDASKMLDYSTFQLKVVEVYLQVTLMQLVLLLQINQ